MKQKPENVKQIIKLCQQDTSARFSCTQKYRGTARGITNKRSGSVANRVARRQNLMCCRLHLYSAYSKFPNKHRLKAFSVL